MEAKSGGHQSGAMTSAAEQELARVLTGIQAMLQRQSIGIDQLAAQAATVDDRFAQGEANLVTAMSGLEKCLSESENKLSAALAGLAGTMTGFRSGLEQQLAASDARLSAALNQMTTAMATSMPTPQGPPQAAAQSPAPAAAQAAASVPGVLDAWAQGRAASAAAAAGSAQYGQAPPTQYAALPPAASAVLNARRISCTSRRSTASWRASRTGWTG